MDKMSMDQIYQNVIHAYDNIAQKYTDAYAENDDMDSKYLQEFLKRINGKKILDMGCGTGVNTQYIAGYDLNVIGVDASEGMLKVAHKNFPNLTFVKSDILNTPFEDNSFDGIVLAYVINHFSMDGLEMLRHEIDRVLKDNGILFISAHIGDREELVKDPLDDKIEIYYNFLNIEILDKVFSKYKREYYIKRKSFGAEEFLCDKMFLIYRKNKTTL